MPKQKVSSKYVLKQSLKVFRSKGYNHTSMVDIAEACGLKKGSLYHYYKSKEELMKAVIEHMHEYFTREAFVHAYDEQLGAKQKFQLMADISETQYFASEYGCIFGNLALETAGVIPELFEKVKAFFEDWIAALSHVFSSKFSPEKAKELAEESVAEIEGAVMMMRIFNNKDFLKRANARILQRFEQNVVNQTTPPLKNKEEIIKHK